jgi:hypothetical protein
VPFVASFAVGEPESPKAPLLVLQGDNGPPVLKEEAELVVALLKKDGKTVEAHYYTNAQAMASKNVKTRSTRSSALLHGSKNT